jgi:type II secretory pathway pseudopilin PulG
MISARDERGLTLIELLVAMVISMIVMGSVLVIITVVLNDNRYDGYRDDAQADARSMIDRLGRDLRNAASPSAGSSGLLQEASSYDLAFQSVKPTGSAPSGNAANQIWVRYCLNGQTNTLWRQTTPASSTTPTSIVPDYSACPSTDSAWQTTSGGSPCCMELSDVTNEIGGDNRPLFTFGPSSWQNLSDIKSVEVDMFIDRNPAKLPGPTEITSGIYLRNELGPPSASFTVSKTSLSNGADIELNGSASTDPNGQALSYQWYQGASCPVSGGAPSSGAIPNATSQQFDAGDYPNGTYTFTVVVTNTGGLTSCAPPQGVTVP